MSRRAKRITMKAARQRLALLWLGGAGLCVLVLIAMSIRALEGRQVQVWGWFLPTVLPTLTLILSTFAVTVRDRLPKVLSNRARVDSFVFRLAFGISAFYLALVFFAIVGWQLTAYEDPVDAFVLSNLWLGPLQGIAASTIGWFFLSAAEALPRGEEDEEDGETADSPDDTPG